MNDLLSEGTLHVMEERRRKRGNTDSYTCEGRCGNTLRPYRRTSAEFPDTLMEYSEHRCIGCWYALMAGRHPEDPLYAVLACPGCGWKTRPARAPESAFPGTRRREANGGLRCYACVKGGPTQASVETMQAGLDRFLSRIRGTSTRPRNPYSPN